MIVERKKEIEECEIQGEEGTLVTFKVVRGVKKRTENLSEHLLLLLLTSLLESSPR